MMRIAQKEQMALKVAHLILANLRADMMLPKRVAFDRLEALAGSYFSRAVDQRYTDAEAEAVTTFSALLDDLMAPKLDVLLAMLQAEGALPPSIQPGKTRQIHFKMKVWFWHGWTISHQKKRVTETRSRQSK